MNTVNKNQLEKLAGYQVVNTEVLKSIVGGTQLEADSKKKDVTSTSQDSASNDKFKETLTQA
jgi:hypothetical protein